MATGSGHVEIIGEDTLIGQGRAVMSGGGTAELVGIDSLSAVGVAVQGGQPVAGTLTAYPGSHEVEVQITGASATGAAWRIETAGTWSSWTNWSTLTGTVFIQLQPATTYRFQHKVRNSAGDEVLGSIITATTTGAPDVTLLPVLPSVRSSASTSHSSGTLGVTAETVKRPQLVEAGDLLVLYTVMDAGILADLTPPSGFTQLGELATGANNPVGSVAYKVAGSAEPATYTYGRFSADSDGASLMVAVRDWDGNTANLRFAQHATDRTARTVPQVTPAGPAGLVLTSAHHDATSSTNWGWVAPGQGLLAGVSRNAGGWSSVGVAAHTHTTGDPVTGLAWTDSRITSTVAPMVTTALTIGAGTRTVVTQKTAFSAGTGGPLTDATNLTFNNGTFNHTYHRYAAGLDWTKPVGLLIWTDGSAEFGLTNPSSQYLLAGPNGMIAVAKRHNMILLTPMAPGGGCNDGDGVCWYDSSGSVTAAQKLAWSNALIAHVFSQYDIDRSRVAFGGYSSGAQWTSQFFGPGHAHEHMVDGVAVPVSYGGAPLVTNTNHAAFRANVAMHWNTGELDSATSTQSWGSLGGYNHYAAAGYANVTITVVGGGTHDRYVSSPTEGEFGRIMHDAIVRHVRPAVHTTQIVNHFGSAVLAAGGDTAGSGSPSLRPSTVTMPGVGTMAAAGVAGHRGAASLSAAGVIEGAGQTSQEGGGTAILHGDGTIVGAATDAAVVESVAVTADGSVEVVGVSGWDGSATLTGTGSVSAAGTGEAAGLGAGELSASGTVSAVGVGHIPTEPPRLTRPGPAYTLDGIPLDDPAGRWWVSDRTGETRAPALVLHTLNVMAGQVGEIDAPSPAYGAAVWPLIMGIRGGDYAEAKAFKDQLDRFLLGRHSPVTVIEDSPNGAKMCRGIVAEGTEVERFDSGFRIDVAYPVRIPAGRWFDTVEHAVTCGPGNRIAGDAQDGTYLLAPLLGGSRDMDPIIVTIGNGSNTDVRVTDVASGQWVRIAGNIILGTPIVIDPLNLTATAGGTPASGLLDFSARDLYLSPSATVRVQQNGTQPVTIRARRAYT